MRRTRLRGRRRVRLGDFNLLMWTESLRWELATADGAITSPSTYLFDV